MAVQVRETVQGYELLERIGAGGFGVVYRALQSSVGREVAVKIIRPAFANDPEFIRRFDREAQLIARLEHIHIVPLYDYWRDPDGAFIVMRWLRGGAVDGALQKGPFTLESASLLLDQVASGLAAAHSQNVVHRDLKPSNILLDDEGNAYLSDFGIAVDLQRSDSPSERGNSRASPDADRSTGSMGYMSPEQLRGQLATPQSDIYSLGVTLYELLAGQRPFPNLNSVQQLFKHIDEPLPSIDSVDSAIAAEVNAVIQVATAKNPEKRYPDALAMAAAFRAAASISDPVDLAESLTLREHEILRLLVEGKSNRKIAEALYVELPTVKWHITNIYKKLGVRTRVQAIVRARELKLIGSPVEESVLDASERNVTVAPSEPANPYKGLRAFESADEKDFFGREAAVQRILEKLDIHASHANGAPGRFLAIVGPSGSGKSSLVKAGLIPALWSGRLAGSEKWFVVNFVPGPRPLDSLETSLTRIAADQANNVRTHLDRDGHGLSRVADLILPKDDSELVVIVDQFEELFTLVEDESSRRHFLDLLASAASDPRSRVRVIVSLRADYYDRPLQYPGFGRLIRAHIETLLPLTAEGMERAIVRPAEQVGIAIEPGLVASMIEDVSYQPGSLPLLQYALTELFDQRSNGLMTGAAFTDIGGAGGALARRAEELYQEQDAEGREMVRQMFLRLVTIVEPKGAGATDRSSVTETRRRTLRSELTSAASDPDRLDDIIETFADFRLLTLDHDPVSRRPTVEIAHEALLQNWDRLHAWLVESQTDLHMHRQLVRMTGDWADAHMDDSFLLRGARLANFGSWSAETPMVLTEEERAFLDASLVARDERAALERTRQEEQVLLERRSNRRLKGLVGVMAVALALVTGLSIAAVSLARQAEEQQQIAEKSQRLATARELAAASLANLEMDQELSVLLALEAAETTLALDGSILPEVVELLHAAVQADRTEATFPTTGPVAFSPDGKTLAIGASNGADLRLWDANNGQEIHRLIGHSRRISDLAFSPDGRHLASSSYDRRVRMWDTASGLEIGTIIGHDSEVEGVAFGPYGELIATIDKEATLRIWDVALIAERTSANSDPIEFSEWIFHQEMPAEATDVAYSPDGQRVAAFVPNNGIFVWAIASGEQLLEIVGVSENKSDLVYSPDGNFLAGSSEDFGAGIWDVSTGEQVLFLPESSVINGVAFSQDGRTLATATKHGAVTLWDTETRAPKLRILGRPTGFNYLALSPDGTQAAAGLSSSRTAIWDVGPLGSRELLTVAAHDGKVYDAIYDPSGSLIASTGQDGSLKLWDAFTGQLRNSFPAQANAVHLPGFGPNGERVAAVNRMGGVTIWDVASGNEILSLRGDGSSLRTVDFSPDGSKIAAGGGEGLAFLWDSVSGQRLSAFEIPEQTHSDLAFSPDGTHLTSYGGGGIAYSWRGDSIGPFEGPSTAFVGSLVVCASPLWDGEFTQDGRLQAMAGADAIAHIYTFDAGPGDVSSYTRLHSLAGHDGDVTGIAFNPEGSILASAGSDGTARLWDIGTGEQISTLIDQQVALAGVDISPDGRYVLTAGEDGMLRIFFTSVEDLMEHARTRLSRDLTNSECQQYLHLPACTQDD